MAAATVLDRLLEPLTECFTPEVARRVASLRADIETQERLDKLAAKANEGDLTNEENDEYRAYVDVGVRCMIFPRFRGHPNWRENAHGVIHGQAKETT